MFQKIPVKMWRFVCDVVKFCSCSHKVSLISTDLNILSLSRLPVTQPMLVFVVIIQDKGRSVRECVVMFTGIGKRLRYTLFNLLLKYSLTFILKNYLCKLLMFWKPSDERRHPKIKHIVQVTELWNIALLG